MKCELSKRNKRVLKKSLGDLIEEFDGLEIASELEFAEMMNRTSREMLYRVVEEFDASNLEIVNIAQVMMVIEHAAGKLKEVLTEYLVDECGNEETREIYKKMKEQ